MKNFLFEPSIIAKNPLLVDFHASNLKFQTIETSSRSCTTRKPTSRSPSKRTKPSSSSLVNRRRSAKPGWSWTSSTAQLLKRKRWRNSWIQTNAYAIYIEFQKIFNSEIIRSKIYDESCKCFEKEKWLKFVFFNDQSYMNEMNWIIRRSFEFDFLYRRKKTYISKSQNEPKSFKMLQNLKRNFKIYEISPQSQIICRLEIVLSIDTSTRTKRCRRIAVEKTTTKKVRAKRRSTCCSENSERFKKVLFLLTFEKKCDFSHIFWCFWYSDVFVKFEMKHSEIKKKFFLKNSLWQVWNETNFRKMIRLQF